MMTVGMGAVFALGFFAIIGFIIAVITSIALCFFAESMTFLGIWIHRKRKKLDCQKVFKVFFIICLSLSIATVVVPVTAVAVGIGKSAIENYEPYVDTGVEIEQDTDHISDYNHFTFDGVEYYDIDSRGFDAKECVQTPVANPKDSRKNIYEVENISGKRILKYDKVLYCAYENRSYILKFYRDQAESDYYLVSQETDEQILMDDFTNRDFKTIRAIRDLDKKTDLEIQTYSESGVEYSVIRKSVDGVYTEEVDIFLIDDKTFVQSTSVVTSYILDNEDVEKKLKENIKKLNEQ